MGDPKKIRKKYRTPSHPWQKSRIDEEKSIIQEYGFTNKKEIWKMGSVLRNFKQRIKKATTHQTAQSETEKQHLLNKLQSLGLTKGLASADEILGLTLKDILERRLQTIVFRKGLARSMKQARQMITHRHIVVGTKMITSPSYLVQKGEEDKVGFVAKSGFTNPEHPERITEKGKE